MYKIVKYGGRMHVEAIFTFNTHGGKVFSSLVVSTTHRDGRCYQRNVYLLKNWGQILQRWKSGHLKDKESNLKPLASKAENIQKQALLNLNFTKGHSVNKLSKFVGSLHCFSLFFVSYSFVACQGYFLSKSPGKSSKKMFPFNFQLSGNNPECLNETFVSVQFFFFSCCYG